MSDYAKIINDTLTIIQGTLDSAYAVQKPMSPTRIVYILELSSDSHRSLKGSVARGLAALADLQSDASSDERLRLASIAPRYEIEMIAGTSSVEIAAFLGMSHDDYDYDKHHHLACIKARFVWADMMIQMAREGATGAGDVMVSLPLGKRRHGTITPTE